MDQSKYCSCPPNGKFKSDSNFCHYILEPEPQHKDVTYYKFSPLYVEVKLAEEETSLFPVWFVEWHLQAWPYAMFGWTHPTACP